MKTSLFTAAAILGLVFAGTAAADEDLSAEAEQFERGCMDFQAQYGGTTDCTCLAETFDEDEDFAAEMMAIMGPEDLDNLSEDAVEEIEACDEENM